MHTTDPLDDRTRTLIERALKGDLDEATRQELADTRPTDADTAALATEAEDWGLALRAAGRADFKQELQQWEQAYQQAPAKPGKATIRKLRRRSLVGVAAAVAILLMVAVLYLMPGDNDDRYFAEVFEPYPNVVAPIVRDNTGLSRVEQAFYAYESTDYERAAALLAALPPSPEYDFYEGVALLAIGETVAAQELFDTVLASDDNQLKQPAQWYNALAALQLGEVDVARPLLQNIADAPNHLYQDQAEELLENLN